MTHTLEDVVGYAEVSNITDLGALSIKTNNSTDNSAGNITRQKRKSVVWGKCVHLTARRSAVHKETENATNNLADGQAMLVEAQATDYGDLDLDSDMCVSRE